MSDPAEALRDVPRLRVGSLNFSVTPLGDAVTLITQLIAPTRGVAVHFANAFNVALGDVDHDYRDMLNHGALVFSDGMPVVWAGRRLYPHFAPIWERVYGPDVMSGVLQSSTQDTQRHYLLGGTPDTLRLLTRRIELDWPNATIVGAESPPFREPIASDLEQRDLRIAGSGATHVWVGLGTPKQDFEVNRLASKHPLTALAVGAAFDFLAGQVQQAPVWVQHNGLEWAFRLSQEPQRLARRYLWGNPRFIASVARQAMARDARSLSD